MNSLIARSPSIPLPRGIPISLGGDFSCSGVYVAVAHSVHHPVFVGRRACVREAVGATDRCGGADAPRLVRSNG